MIQLIIAGVWACLVSLGTAYGVIFYLQRPKAPSDAASHEKQIEQIKSKVITIPLSKAGSVTGYVRVQFSFSIEKAVFAKLPVKPDIILVDEAYRSMTDIQFADPQRPSRAELTKITQMLKDGIGQRIGSTAVNDVWIQDYSYLPLTSVRGAAAK